MNKQEIIAKLQKLIDEQFDKILKIKFGNDEYRIAITQDSIPKIIDINLEENDLSIMFSDFDFEEYNSELFKLFTERGKEIQTLIISNIDNLRKGNNKKHLSREFLNYIKNLPENSNKEILRKHTQNRFAHAVSEFLSDVNNKGEFISIK